LPGGRLTRSIGSKEQYIRQHVFHARRNKPFPRNLSVRTIRMRKPKHIFALASCALFVASCGSADQDEPTAVKESSIAEDQMNSADNPFAASEMAMKNEMMGAIGSSVSDTWVKQMIAHHRGAIAMSEAVLKLNPSADVRMMAEQVISKQGKEIESLASMSSKAASDPASLEPFKSANMAMHEAMMAATGADVSKLYLRKMLAHHDGGVALSEIAIAKGKDAKVRAAAEKTRSDQAKEAAMVKDMLAGKPMNMADGPRTKPAATKATSIPAAERRTAAPVKAAPVAKAPPKTTATPPPSDTPDPHAGHDMKQPN
jgi:uncharacterized protein (DUF305 family)